MRRLALLLVVAACDRPSAVSQATPVAVVMDSGPMPSTPAPAPAPPSASAMRLDAFDLAVGTWRIAEAGGVTGLLVDGSGWHEGMPTFPLAIAKAPPPSGDVRLRVRFYPMDGKVDQGAGIAFNIAPDGSYLAARANALEDNVLFFKIVNGKRTVSDRSRSARSSSYLQTSSSALNAGSSSS